MDRVCVRDDCCCPLAQADCVKGRFSASISEILKAVSAPSPKRVRPSSRPAFWRRPCAPAAAYAQRKPPENAGEPKNNARCNDKVQHQLHWLSKRFDEQPSGDVRNNYDRNDPAENHAKNPWENHIRIASNVQEVKVAVNQALRPHDPKTYCCQAEHDGVVHGDAKSERGQVQQNRYWGWHDSKLRQRNADYHATQRRVDDAVEGELFSGNSKLAVER